MVNQRSLAHLHRSPGFRLQVFITDQDDADLAQLEAHHRARAHVEDRIRGAGKDTGLRNFPFRQLASNQVGLELVLVAQDLLTFFQRLCLDGEARRLVRRRDFHPLARGRSRASPPSLLKDRG